MKKITAALITVFMLLCSISVFAAPDIEYIEDNAGVLTATEEDKITDRLMSVSDKYGIHALILTINAPSISDIESYAGDRLEYYADGKDYSCVLMVVNTAKNERYIAACGKCQKPFSEDVIRYIGKDIAKSIDSGNYYEAFDKYADYTDQIMSGDFKLPVEISMMAILVILGIAVVVTFFGTRMAKSAMNDAVTPVNADIYAKGGTASITMSRDLFLYSHVTRTRRESNRGSSSHTNSSGRSFSGSKF